MSQEGPAGSAATTRAQQADNAPLPLQAAPRWNQATPAERETFLKKAGVIAAAIPGRVKAWREWAAIPEGGTKERLRRAMRQEETSPPVVRSSNPGQVLTPQEKIERMLLEDPTPVSPALQEKHGKELRDAADALYRDLRPATNESDGKTVRFVRKAFKEMRQHSADERVMRIVPSLRHLFESATPLWVERDDGSHGRVIAWHNYGVRASVDGQDTVVRLVARELDDGTLELLHHDADVRATSEIKNAMSGLAERSQQPKPGGQQNLSSRKDRLLQWIDKIHPDNNRLSRDGGFSNPLSPAHARAQLVEALGEKALSGLERAGRLKIHAADPTHTGAAGYVD
ncbi:MAG: hypothetical protein WAT67_15275, partial [Candidatus Contendobacter sp.]